MGKYLVRPKSTGCSYLMLQATVNMVEHKPGYAPRLLSTSPNKSRILDIISYIIVSYIIFHISYIIYHISYIISNHIIYVLCISSIFCIYIYIYTICIYKYPISPNHFCHFFLQCPENRPR
jgi:hypothetical protein